MCKSNCNDVLSAAAVGVGMFDKIVLKSQGPALQMWIEILKFITVYDMVVVSCN